MQKTIRQPNNKEKPSESSLIEDFMEIYPKDSLTYVLVLFLTYVPVAIACNSKY